VTQRAVWEGRSTTARHDVIVEEHPFNTDFNQRMIVTDTHKLVFFANRPYGELYDLTTDPTSCATSGTIRPARILNKSAGPNPVSRDE